ncbi:MAG: hypothetical protein ABIK08_11215 [Pseudomonadota bacterium]
MMAHPDQFPSVSPAQLATFSSDGRLYRAYNHVVAALSGAVLLVPMYLVRGELSGLVDGCPVPWEEVDDVLRMAPAATHAFDFAAEPYSPLVMGLADLFPGRWSLDFVNINRSSHHAWRLQHACGPRFACTADRVYQE